MLTLDTLTDYDIDPDQWADDVTDAYAEITRSGDVELRTDYSGRGMYGDTCIAYVCDDPVALGAAIAQVLTRDGMEDAIRDFLPSRQDSMGLSTVLY